MNKIITLVGELGDGIPTKITSFLDYTADHLLNFQSIYYYKHRWPGFASWVSKQYWAGGQPAEPHQYPLNMNMDFAAPSVDSRNRPYLSYVRKPTSPNPTWAACEVDLPPTFVINDADDYFTARLQYLPVIWGEDVYTVMGIQDGVTGENNVLVQCIRDPVSGADAYYLETYDGTHLNTSGNLVIPNALGDPLAREVRIRVDKSGVSLEIAAEEGGNRYTELNVPNLYTGGNNPKFCLFYSPVAVDADIEAHIFSVNLAATQ